MRRLSITAALIVLGIFSVFLVIVLLLTGSRSSFVTGTVNTSSSSSACAINEEGQCVRGRGTFEKVAE